MKESEKRKKKLPSMLKIESVLENINFDKTAAVKKFIIHPYLYYVGIKLNKKYLNVNEKFDAQFVVTDISGKIIKDQVIYFSIVPISRFFLEKDQKVEQQPLLVDEIISGDKIITKSYEIKISGIYKIIAILKSGDNGNYTSQQISVISNAFLKDKLNKKEDLNFSVLLDKDLYRLNEDVNIILTSPYEEECEGIYILAKEVPFLIKNFKINKQTKINFDIKKEYYPNINFLVIIKKPGSDKDSFVIDKKKIKISDEDRTLKIEINKKEADIRPFQENNLKIKVSNYKNEVLENCPVILLIVDESSLALTNFILKNPLETFFKKKKFEFEFNSILDFLMLKDDKLDETIKNPFKEKIFGKNEHKEFSMKKVFNRKEEKADYTPMREFSIAKMEEKRGRIKEEEVEVIEIRQEAPITTKKKMKFRNEIKNLLCFEKFNTDKNGEINYNIKTSDFLTRYRIIVLACYDLEQFGIKEDQFKVSIPLTIRSTLPRFLYITDKSIFQIIFDNETDKKINVDIMISLTGMNINDKTLFVKKINKNETNFDVIGLKTIMQSFEKKKLELQIETMQPGDGIIKIFVQDNNNMAVNDKIQIKIPVYVPKIKKKSFVIQN